MKAEIFQGDADEVKEALNEFLTRNKNIKVLKTTQTQSASTTLFSPDITITVYYEGELTSMPSETSEKLTVFEICICAVVVLLFLLALTFPLWWRELESIL